MNSLKPVLKWAGGKQNLINELNSVFSNYDFENHTFYDAFVGGGSVFLSLANKKAVINDYNSELINVYQVIKDNHKELITELKKHQSKHSSEYYYKVREMDRKKTYDELSNIKKAARTIYLNRTCFNGLMRYNKDGFFNVPVGRYSNPSIVMEERIYDIHTYLNENKVEIVFGDFENACKTCKKGDLIYFDPPYDYDTDGFTNYTKDGWSREDLCRLKKLCDRLVKKGCHIVVSNNETKYVKQLFSEYNMKFIKAHRFINSKPGKRNNVSEVIIYG